MVQDEIEAELQRTVAEVRRARRWRMVAMTSTIVAAVGGTVVIGFILGAVLSRQLAEKFAAIGGIVGGLILGLIVYRRFETAESGAKVTGAGTEAGDGARRRRRPLRGIASATAITFGLVALLRWFEGDDLVDAGAVAVRYGLFAGGFAAAWEIFVWLVRRVLPAPALDPSDAVVPSTGVLVAVAVAFDATARETIEHTLAGPATESSGTRTRRLAAQLRSIAETRARAGVRVTHAEVGKVDLAWRDLVDQTETSTLGATVPGGPLIVVAWVLWLRGVPLEPTDSASRFGSVLETLVRVTEEQVVETRVHIQRTDAERCARAFPDVADYLVGGPFRG